MELRKDYFQVIVVDDDEYILDFMKSELELNNLCVKSFSSGPEAIKFIELPENKSECFFLITDYCMPEMSGLDMIEKLHAKGGFLASSILLTGFIPPNDLERASKIKGLEVMEKPVDLDRLISLIKTSTPCEV